jgi:uncharacterized protein YutE (UPF0331/DUF86 family)
MDWLSFGASVVHSLAWPVAIFSALLLLRKELISLMPRLSKVRYKDLEFTLIEQISEAKREINIGLAPLSITESTSTSAATGGTTEAGTPSYFEAIAEVSPRAALLEAWHYFEQTAMTAAIRLGLMKAELPIQIRDLFRILEQAKLLTPSEEKALTNLRQARNAVVHAAEVEVPREPVAEYATLLLQIAARVHERSNTALKPKP